MHKAKMICLLLATGVAIQANAAVFYKHKDYQEAILVANGPVARVDDNINDQISSVASNQCVTLYEHEYFGGMTSSFLGSQADLKPYPMQDRTTSIDVYDSIACQKAVLYEHKDFNAEGGRTYTPPLNVAVSNIGGFMNDRTTAIKVPDRICLEVWIDAPPKDPAQYNAWRAAPTRTFYPGSYSNISDLGLNDKITAVNQYSCNATGGPIVWPVLF